MCGTLVAEDAGCRCPKWTAEDIAQIESRKAALAWFFDDAPELPPGHDVGNEG